jgi:hypothetical protein
MPALQKLNLRGKLEKIALLVGHLVAPALTKVDISHRDLLESLDISFVGPLVQTLFTPLHRENLRFSYILHSPTDWTSCLESNPCLLKIRSSLYYMDPLTGPRGFACPVAVGGLKNLLCHMRPLADQITTFRMHYNDVKMFRSQFEDVWIAELSIAMSGVEQVHVDRRAALGLFRTWATDPQYFPAARVLDAGHCYDSQGVRMQVNLKAMISALATRNENGRAIQQINIGSESSMESVLRTVFEPSGVEVISNT